MRSSASYPAVFAVTAACLAFSLGGCGTPTERIPPERLYVPPSSDAPVATLLGGTAEGSGGTYTVYVRAVDDKRITGGSKMWSSPVRVRAGRSTIDVSIKRGRFFGIVIFKGCELLSGHTYELRVDGHIHPVLHEGYAVVWLVDNVSGQEVAPRQRVDAIPPQVPIIIPIPVG